MLSLEGRRPRDMSILATVINIIIPPKTAYGSRSTLDEAEEDEDHCWGQG